MSFYESMISHFRLVYFDGLVGIILSWGSVMLFLLSLFLLSNKLKLSVRLFQIAWALVYTASTPCLPFMERSRVELRSRLTDQTLARKLTKPVPIC